MFLFILRYLLDYVYTIDFDYVGLPNKVNYGINNFRHQKSG